MRAHSVSESKEHILFPVVSSFRVLGFRTINALPCVCLSHKMLVSSSTSRKRLSITGLESYYMTKIQAKMNRSHLWNVAWSASRDMRCTSSGGEQGITRCKDANIMRECAHHTHPQESRSENSRMTDDMPNLSREHSCQNYRRMDHTTLWDSRATICFRRLVGKDLAWSIDMTTDLTLSESVRCKTNNKIIKRITSLCHISGFKKLFFPPKNALIALFPAQVRPMFIKISENLRPVPIIMYQVHIRLYSRHPLMTFFNSFTVSIG